MFRQMLFRRMFAYLLSAAVSAAILLGAAPAALAESTTSTAHYSASYTVTSKDGVKLAVQESGNPNGRPIVFVHGLLGSRLNWEAQVQSPELRQYRLITYDLRGHGLSDKPAGVEPYRDGRRWADDLDAVIQGAHAIKPVVVGWSLGGVVISNYLAAYGDSQIAGGVYVDGVVELAPGQIVAHPEVYRDMTSPDLKTHLDSERTFIGLCFNHRPDAATFGRLLANGAMASWDMQKAVPTMSVFAAEGLGKAHVPLLFVYGARDALVDTPRTLARAAALNPHIETRVYADAGHAAFIEQPERFNRDLAAFVRAAFAQ